ncbi:MAG: hypothetical protein IPL61_03135 [Myxococcales bacterium]|nr:hypothetical protein [Myxococcales bacterium]
MFKRLLRQLIDSVREPHVGLVTEPTAIVTTRERRELRRVSLEQWHALAPAHAKLAMSAGLVSAGPEDRHAYAVVAIAGESELVIVELPTPKDLAGFIEKFVDAETQASRSLNRFDLVAARILPPPPPPPPGYPPIDLIARLEAGLRLMRVPVMIAAVEVQLGFETAER